MWGGGGGGGAETNLARGDLKFRGWGGPNFGGGGGGGQTLDETMVC